MLIVKASIFDKMVAKFYKKTDITFQIIELLEIILHTRLFFLHTAEHHEAANCPAADLSI